MCRIIMLILLPILLLLAIGCKTMQSIHAFATDPVGAAVDTAAEAVISNAQIKAACKEVERIVSNIKFLEQKHGEDWVIDAVILADMIKTVDKIYDTIYYLVREGGLGTCIAAAANFGTVKETISNLYNIVTGDTANLSIGRLSVVITFEP